MDIEAAVYCIIADLSTDRTADVGPGWRLIEENGVDSLFFVELVLRLEATLGISLPDEEVAGAQTAGELVALCKAKLVKREPR